MGEDISATMIENVGGILSRLPNAKTALNERTNLGQLADASFDIVAAHFWCRHMAHSSAVCVLVVYPRIRPHLPTVQQWLSSCRPVICGSTGCRK